MAMPMAMTVVTMVHNLFLRVVFLAMGSLFVVLFFFVGMLVMSVLWIYVTMLFSTVTGV